MQASCQFNQVWFKKIGFLALFLGLVLLAGFFIFNFNYSNQEIVKDKEIISEKEEDQPKISNDFSSFSQEGSSQSNKVDLSQSDLALKKKIGQMIMVGFRGFGLKDNPELAKQIKEGSVGGVILFDYDTLNKTYQRNIQNKTQLKKLIADLQAITSTILFIGVDEEGGYVERLKEKYGFEKNISAEKIGELGQEMAFEAGARVGKELKEVGINMNFAPVVDVNLNPNNPIISKLERSFSVSSKEVALMAEQFILGQNKAGIISVAKHFPGHGSSLGDSHLGIVDITNTYKQEELVPYYYLQSQDILQVVMTGHLINKNIDQNLPATLSKNFLADILRKEIGFQGLIISDDLQMKAIADNYGFEEAIILAVQAGCNVLIFSNNTGFVYDDQIAQKAVEIIFRAVKEGKIKPEKIDQSFALISSFKEKF